MLGDVLTVAGLVGIGEVLPRASAGSPATYPPGTGDRWPTALPDRGVMAGGRGALGRHRRTFMIEQRALIDELPAVTAALGATSTSRWPWSPATGTWWCRPGRRVPWPGGIPGPS